MLYYNKGDTMQSITEFDIVMKDQTEPITIYIRNTLTNDLVDVSATSTFRLIKISDDSLVDSGSFGSAGSAKITRLDTGIYQYNFNAETYPLEYILTIRAVLANESINTNVFIKSAASKQFAYAAQLRGIIDKSRKSVKDDLANMDQTDFEPSLNFFYGYTDAHMIYYLERGMQMLNAIPPYTAMGVDDFPFPQYGAILLDAATIAGLEAQGIFAIDTDFNYSLGGNQLVIDHFSKLSSAVSSILARFTKTSVGWKQQYRTKGMVMFQYLPGGVRSARVLNSAPSGFWSRLLSQVYS